MLPLPSAAGTRRPSPLTVSGDTDGTRHQSVLEPAFRSLDSAAVQFSSVRWRNDPGWRIAGGRPLDASKVQAPGVPRRPDGRVARSPDGRMRLFYTGVGPGRPFPRAQGSILSAVSEDGLDFQV